MAELSQKTALKRFYQQVSVRPAVGGWEVLLDQRVLKTPAQRALVLPSEQLARALCEEWAQQGTTIDAQTMPLMTLTCTALDWVVDNRTMACETLVDYGAHDLICYWDHATQQLLNAQKEIWGPLLKRCETVLKAPLTTTAGLRATAQPLQSMQTFARAVARCSDFQLSALLSLVREGGSLVVGLLALAGQVTEQQALDAVVLHNRHQIDRWGADAEAQARIVAIGDEFAAVFRFLSCGQLWHRELIAS